ncbi:MAG: RHS repeat protein [Candidatus Obscuribacter phosphatis]|uniref:RHS repeat protein n=1 Tax=Candidatus Obscuribacter phosphatis TaxID=1906157 RepID=A0A8J7TQA3_9BACT|nr:RHS repeat protein [Candidatus Obscuribacter phosphatis]
MLKSIYTNLKRKTVSKLLTRSATAVDGKGQTTTYTYDSVTGSLLTVQQPQVAGQTPTTTFTYNTRGQVLTITDPTGIVSKVNYHATLERIESTVADFGTGRLNLTSSFGYNSVGDITSVTDPRGNSCTVTYDVLRRQTQLTPLCQH